MRIELAHSVSQAALGSGYTSSNVNNLPLAVHRSRLRRDRSQVVDLEFEGGIAYSGGEHGLYDTTQRRVQERRHNPSMHRSKRIVMILRWLSGKDDTSLAHLRHPHAHQDSDGRWRKLT